ncbi:MAG: (4Fe-4S)-binding protein [Coxiella sp. DG_40]|nr:MAG: (4Fe-4S)-binding protein [Coxiella sp. DG_40]
MKQIVVISGKGGTGKTVITGALAVLANNKIMVDCDVDAADLHLLLHPQPKEQHQFRCGATAFIKQEICVKCGKCQQVCRFDAVKNKYFIDPISCEGCAFCSHICPVKAIEMRENISGEWYISDTDYGPFVHAKLGIGEENSGKLVALVRQKAKRLADQKNSNWVIIDGPPGIGCPVIASVVGVDKALIVTEPTLSGIHDFKRILKLVKQLNIPAIVVINKFDINLENSNEIEIICEQQQIAFVQKIPYSKEVPKAITAGKIINEYSPHSEVSSNIEKIWNFIRD